MSIKKVFLGFAVVALVFGMSVVPAKADQISDLQAMIAQLTAQISALSGGTTPTGGGYTFTTNLAVGSKGAAVTALQEILISGGYLNIAAPTGYFGNLTKAAVMKWQTANDLTADGKIGPISRGVLNAMPGAGTTYVPPLDTSGPCSAGQTYNSMTGALCSAGTTLPAGCTSTAGFSPTTGLSCAGTVTTVTYPAGCTSATGFSPTTGMSCATVTSGTTTGATEGSMTTKLASTPVPNADIRTTNDVSVYGIEVTAIGSDMTVDRVDLQVSVTPTGGSASNPGSFINKIAFYNGSTLLKEMAVSSSDFTKDSSDRYHAIISGLGFQVLKGTKKDLTVKFSVNSLNTTDANRAVVVSGYAGNSNNIRATDGVGLQSYTDMSGTANQRSHTFKPAGSSTLAVTIDSAGTPKSNNVRMPSSGLSKTKVLAFSAKATDGDAKITKMYAQINATNTDGLPDTLYLTDEAGAVLGTSDASSVANGSQSGFTGLDIPIAKDTSKKFFILADFPIAAAGDAASTTLVANSVQWEKPDGSTASTTPSGALTSNDQYFWGAVPRYSLYGTPTVTKSIDSGSTLSTTTLNFELKVKVEADGGSLVKPVYTSQLVRDFTIGFASTSQTTFTAGNNLILALPGSATSSLTMTAIDPTNTTVGDGGSYIMTFVGTMVNRDASVGAPTPGGLIPLNGRPAPYFMVLATASSTVGGGAVTGQTWGLEGIQTPSGTLD